MVTPEPVDEPCGVTDPMPYALQGSNQFVPPSPNEETLTGAHILQTVRETLDKLHRTILVHADDEQRVRDALAAVGIGPDDKLWRVVVNVFMEPGMAYVLPAETRRIEVKWP